MSDFRRAVAWYEEILGLEAESYWPPEALKYAHFETGAAQFAISELDPVPAAGRYNFSVRDVDAWWEKLRGRAEVVEPLFDTPYGTRKFTVRDPAAVSVRINGGNKRVLKGVFRWEGGKYRLDHQTGA